MSQGDPADWGLLFSHTGRVPKTTELAKPVVQGDDKV